MKTPTEQIKEIEKEIEVVRESVCQYCKGKETEKMSLFCRYKIVTLEAKLQVLKEWEARENYILEIIDARILACKQNQKRGLKPDNYNEFGDYNEFANRLEELKSKIKGEGK